jgi:hypothetical protein
VRAELDKIVKSLLALDVITLDAVGDALGAAAVSALEIEAIFAAIEAAGREVVAPPDGRGVERLRKVVAMAKVLRTELGRTPTRDEIAQRSGLRPEEVHHALELAKIMQR